jgi:aromatic ring hydroxylase
MGMAVRTPAAYRESLRDSRVVYYRGRRVEDVTAHPVIGTAVEHACIDFAFAEEAANRELAVYEEEGRAYSRFYKIPRDADDLLRRSALIDATTRRGKTLVVLIKEIGTDAMFALLKWARGVDREMETEYLRRVEAFYRHCRENDLAVSVAQTDVKGDRAARPSQQSNREAYLRIVDRRRDGIVVRGMKVHTSATTNANEVIVLPTRAMGEEDADYAVAFAVPVNTPGLKLIASPYGGAAKSEFDFPLSAGHKMMETMTLFDDVFVPWERVFLAGEARHAGALALGFVEFHRFTAVSYKLPLVDALVGAAALLADYNGIAAAGHVRDKLVWLISYAETLRRLVEMAALRGSADEEGIFAPDALTTNIAKYHFAHNYHQAIAHVQDIAGGLLVTGPGEEDFASAETGDLLERYLGGRAGVGGRDRVRAMNMVSDLTTSEFGGYHAVLAIHAEGSLEAEKLMIYRAYDHGRALRYAKELAGLG